ncbi:DUF2059 domain-containing protein [Oceaniglobus roseus]|uniref:DUF2059 domain-containing protein n=1 Tax=Oceaniglobus roseus TaxID=1737570 RepID=UPI000C7EB488|nr:DUF2059 domain-containing protein [Kandeliimicrobium roseum]
MSRPLAALLFCLAAWPAPAQQAPEQNADAAFIASQVATEEIFRGAVTANRPVIVKALENDLDQRGITLADRDRFFDLFLEEFIAGFTEKMQAETAAIYRNAFNDTQLADIAAFYRTESGQALLRQLPAVMAMGAAAGQRAGQIAGQEAGPRLAARIEAESLGIAADDVSRKRLLDMLR